MLGPWLGWQIPVRTDDVHGAARIESIDTTVVRERLATGQVAVVAGFQGIAPMVASLLWDVVARTHAVALAAALDADRCDIYTDVDGVYTTDPADCAKSKQARSDYLRGNARNGVSWRQGATDPVSCHGHAPQC